MVNLKYSALYSDDLGCEQASVCFLKGEFELKVRGCTFKSDGLNFDFYTKNSKKINNLFYLKDNELIEYVIDIKMPLTLVCGNNEYIEEFLLRVERHKNYYINSLSVDLEGEVYKAKGYDLQEILINMKKKLPQKYKLDYYFPHTFGADYIETNNEDAFYYLKKDCYLKLFNIKHDQELNKLQTVPITYICDKYCLS